MTAWLKLVPLWAWLALAWAVSLVHAALEHDDVLAAAFARLLLWTDPFRLPTKSDAAGGWDLYLRTWRPGKPHPARWPARYAAAVREIYP